MTVRWNAALAVATPAAPVAVAVARVSIVRVDRLPLLLRLTWAVRAAQAIGVRGLMDGKEVERGRRLGDVAAAGRGAGGQVERSAIAEHRRSAERRRCA